MVMVKSMLDTKAEPIAMASQRERGLLCASVSWIIDSMRVGRVAKLIKCTCLCSVLADTNSYTK